MTVTDTPRVSTTVPLDWKEVWFTNCPMVSANNVDQELGWCREEYKKIGVEYAYFRHAPENNFYPHYVHNLDVRSAVGDRLREAAALEASGERAAAQAAVRLAVAAAEGDQLRWPFLEVSGAQQVLRDDTGNPAQFAADLRELLESGSADRSQRRGADVVPGLVEPLTERELAVLSYLPRRIKQRDIAAELYITVNTLKTHLASIYRKLGVSDRDEAAARATELDLL
jgi:ATP/maltotriose-dependent transcriptional regulator MalT